MKKVINMLMGATLLCISNVSAGDKEEVFRASKVGRDKKELFAAFERIQEIEREKKYGSPLSFEILQKLDRGYLVYKIATHNIPITGSQRSYGAGGMTYSSTTKKTNYSQVYYLKTLIPRNLVCKEKIVGIWVQDTNKTMQYTTTIGAKRTVRVLKEVIPEPLSKEEFVKRLKKGETWILNGFRAKKCKPCFGDGKLNGLENYATCGACHGNGFTSSDVLVKW